MQQPVQQPVQSNDLEVIVSKNEKLDLDQELESELLELEEAEDIIEVDVSDTSKNEDLKKEHQ